MNLRKSALWLIVAMYAGLTEPALGNSGATIIVFESGSSRIKPLFAPILDNFALSMSFVSEPIIVVIEGRADSVGTQEANRRLSCERARAVERYLVARGIHPGRTELYGYGEDRPLTETADEVAEMNNRSVSIVAQEGQRGIMMRQRGRDAILVLSSYACDFE